LSHPVIPLPPLVVGLKKINLGARQRDNHINYDIMYYIKPILCCCLLLSSSWRPTWNTTDDSRDQPRPDAIAVIQPITPEHRALIYTKNGNGYVHDNISASIEALQEICADLGLATDITDDPAIFTDDNLKLYQVLIFSNTNNETFDSDDQKLAFQRYIQAGGGFVGIHSASGSERQWPWFWKMLGGKFRRHPPLQPFDIQVIDPVHPATAMLGEVWKWEDECYYLDHLNPDNHILLAADLRTVEDDQQSEYPDVVFGNYFPLSWCHHYDGGHEFYTALGHKIEYYSLPLFRKHLSGGIQWVMNQVKDLDYSKVTTKLISE